MSVLLSEVNARVQSCAMGGAWAVRPPGAVLPGTWRSSLAFGWI